MTLRIKHILLTYVIAVLLAACNSGSPSAKPATDVFHDWSLEVFPALPDTVDGCSASYTYDTTALDSNYLLVTNLEDLAMIRVAGKTIYLQKDERQSSRSRDSTTVEIYSTRYWEISVTTKEVRQSDEISVEKGSLQVEHNGVKKRFRIHGVAGC